MAIDDFKNLKNYLDSFGAEVVKNAKDNLKKAKKVGKLEKSIDFKVVPEVDGFVVQFTMEDYGTFVDKGVKGAGGTIGEKSWGGRRHFVNWKGKRQDSPYKFGKSRNGGLTKGISMWIKTKGLKGRDKKSGRYITDKALVFLIARRIYIAGIHGISFFQKSLMLGMKKYGEHLLGAVKEDILGTLIASVDSKEV